MKVPRKSLERNLFSQGYTRVLAVDEVGMACLAGPVVVCAVSVGPGFYRHWHKKLAWMRDSKLLLPHQRERFADVLAGQAGLKWKISRCSVDTIDRINIYQASRRAMLKALDALRHVQDANDNPIVLVDGNKIIHGLDLPQLPVIKGDRRVWAIAAASILAKVFRDRMMARYAKRFPGYGLEQHKGYPTPLHRERLRQLGPTPLHRSSFRWSPAPRHTES